ncbi:MAG: DUF167 domain-containing protein [Thermomicrobiales bacterium]|nr:DUF167 domain-containing protein [Thermomicrobiales bacterium]MCA9880585.1 DUF167 domain-containing protein [Thermomicrobiales bacterium]
MSSAIRPTQAVVEHPHGCVISLTVAPRSPGNRVEIDSSGSIRVRLSAPPVDGAANASLIKFLSTVLGVPRSKLTIVAGGHSRHKRLLARGLGDAVAWQAFARAAGIDQQ